MDDDNDNDNDDNDDNDDNYDNDDNDDHLLVERQAEGERKGSSARNEMEDCAQVLRDLATCSRPCARPEAQGAHSPLRPTAALAEGSRDHLRGRRGRRGPERQIGIQTSEPAGSGPIPKSQI